MKNKCPNCGYEGVGTFCENCGEAMISMEQPPIATVSAPASEPVAETAPTSAPKVDQSNLEYKRPNCGAPLVFDSPSQKMKCNSCATEMEMKDFQAYDEALKTANQVENTTFDAYQGEEISADGMQSATCQSCGGEIVMEQTTVATECPFCGNPAIVPAGVSNILKPDYVIPFKVDKNAAKASLKNFYKGKFLLPKWFKEDNRIDKLTGMYVPFWLYDADTNSYGLYDATRSHSWTQGSYRYKKTEHYLVSRSGTLRFEKVPADGSEKMDDTMMEAIEPFDYSALSPFSMAYLSGYLADKYDVDTEKNQERINTRIRQSVDSAFRSTAHGYSTLTTRNLNVNMQKPAVHYALFPVWMLNTKFNKKLYSFGMNGQTGKLVGDLPIDWKKAAMIGGAIFVGSFAILGSIGLVTTPLYKTLNMWKAFGVLGSIIAGLSYITYLPFWIKMKEKSKVVTDKIDGNIKSSLSSTFSAKNIGGNIAGNTVSNIPIVGNILGDIVRNKIENGGDKK